MTSKERNSSFELLRIISMFMVLVLHADFQALGTPSSGYIMASPGTSVFKIVLEMASIVAVNVFVLISGYWGIRPSIKGFLKFVFQCFFFSIGIYATMILLGYSKFTITGLVSCLGFMPNTSYWFILSYAFLYLFAPVLNSFINSAERKQIIYVLFCFYLFQTLCAFVFGGAAFLSKGYSASSFMGLYLLAAFVKKYNYPKLVKKSCWLTFYILITFLLTLIWTVSVLLDLEDIYTRILCYSNPLVVMSSLCLVLFFSQLKLKSAILNKIAASSFSVYLLHCHPLLYSFYLSSVSDIQYKDVFLKSICFFGVICLWFWVAILLDFLRIFLWNSISNCNRNSIVSR